MGLPGTEILDVRHGRISLILLLNGELSDAREVTFSELKRTIEQENYPREDYKELVIFSYIFLIGDIGTTFKIRVP